MARAASSRHPSVKIKTRQAAQNVVEEEIAIRPALRARRQVDQLPLEIPSAKPLKPIKPLKRPRARSLSSELSPLPEDIPPQFKKQYLTAGFYCQNAEVSGSNTLIGKRLSTKTTPGISFPPLPMEYGENLFFDEEHEFEIPYDIQWCFEHGKLDGKKRPSPYKYLRASRSL